MTQKSLYRRHRFSPGAIPHAVSFYVRFSLSLRIVEDLMAHRCIIVSHQKMRLWAEKNGREFSKLIRRDRQAALRLMRKLLS
jgi:putative transposase